MSDSYLQMIISKGGGIITCGQHLGIFVSSVENIYNTPPGWCFVDIKDATIELLRNTLDEISKGRSLWPINDLTGAAPQAFKNKKKQL